MLSLKEVLQVLFVGTAICFGPCCCVLVLSETVLVLERSLAGAIIQLLRNVNFIPQGNSHQPINP
ncbi:MAG: hypothetical protein ACK5GJ_00445 [Planctomycetota bacterium]